VLRFSEHKVARVTGRSELWPETLGWTWRLVRLPIVTLLVILEPVVSLVFGGLALLGVLVTLFSSLIRAPHFPTWTMLALSVGFGVAVRLYRGLILILAR
jgi:hypothetical protein